MEGLTVDQPPAKESWRRERTSEELRGFVADHLAKLADETGSDIQ